MGRKKLYKNVAVNCRVDHKTHFMIHLLARMQRRKISNIFETAFLVLFGDEGFQLLVERVWDPDEITRLKNLKEVRPDLLSFDELEKIKEFDKTKGVK